MAELNYPDPSQSPWTDPNGKVWVHDGDGWVCTGESTSEDSVRVTVYDTPGAHTHTFHVNAIRAEVIVTGGGGGGKYDVAVSQPGGAGGTVIKQFDITTGSAAINVGAGGSGGGSSGANGGRGGDSTYDDGSNNLLAEAGRGGGETHYIASGSGGDLIIGGGSGGLERTANNQSSGGSSYWGGGTGAFSPTKNWGVGGGVNASVSATPGADGVVYIKEFLVVKPAPTYALSRAPKTTVYDTAGGPYTHNFDPAARWAKVIVTGGGHSGTQARGRGGPAAGTAIKTFAIGTGTASVTVGAGGVADNGLGGDSSYSDGTNLLTGNAPLDNFTGGVGTGGDINVRGGGRNHYTEAPETFSVAGAASYWGSGDFGGNGAYGSGGSSSTSTGANDGTAGVVVIEEHF